MFLCKKLLSFLPSNNTEDPPYVEGYEEVARNEDLCTILPDDPKKAYDIRRVIAGIVDAGDFLEVQAGRADNLVIAFARIAGNTVGIVANQPAVPLRCPRHRRLGQGGPVRQVLQRLQHPARHPRRRPRVPPRRRPGVRRHHPPRRQDALRLLGGDRPEDHRRPAQGLRRCLSRDVRQGPRRRPGLRLADARRSPSWVPRGRPEWCSVGRSPRRRTPTPSGTSSSSSTGRRSRRPTSPRPEGSSTTSSSRPRPGPIIARALETLRGKRDMRPPKKHGLIPL